MSRWSRCFLLILGACGVGTGCRVGPDYRPPGAGAAATRPWSATVTNDSAGAIATQAEAIGEWWRQFDDPALTELIEQLSRQNLSLLEARLRITEARAARGQLDSQRLPRVDATADAGGAGTGSEGINFRGPPPGAQTELYSLGLAASWELDFWGRVERLDRAAAAQVRFAVEDYRDAAVSLAAELTTAYVDRQIARARLDTLADSIALQQRTLDLVTSDFDAGAGSRLGVAQAQRELAQTRALKPVLVEISVRAENRIAVLLGRRAGERAIPDGPVPRMPRLIGLGLPAELLERRADIRRAIAAYQAAVERIGAAEAEHYPTVTLAGTFNVQSAEASKLFGGHAFTYSLGPALRWPIFQGGRIDALVAERIAVAQQRRAAVERTILEAFSEVENAAVAVARREDRLARLDEAADAASIAAGIADELHRAGLADLLEVIDAQRQLVQLRDQRLQVRWELLIGAIDLYRALGGGWRQMPLPAAPPTTRRFDREARRQGEGSILR